ncbi:MAG: c-type cytochrome [Verrucomicrobiota bacterium]
MSFRLIASIFISALIAVSTVGCRQGMYKQAKHEPLEPSSFYPNNMSARPVIPGTVARGHLHLDRAFYTGMIGTNYITELPLPLNADLLKRGQERYNIYCAVCHDRTGEGNGMIVQRGFPHPPSFHIDRLRKAPLGHFFDVITHGYGVMYPYASRVEPQDRWAIAAYIRVLQQSQNAALSELSAEQRQKLEGGQ